VCRNIVWRNEANDSEIEQTLLLEPLPSSPNNLKSGMKRSESATSLGTPTTAVKDSSLMKRAYKKSEQQLHCGGLLDAYVTLHTGTTSEAEFYKSEMIPNTTNPTFRSLASHFDWMNWYDAASSLLIIRLWTRHSIPESAGQHTEPILGYQNNPTQDQDFQLLLEWELDLNALSWIGKSASIYHLK
jgi:hypothetical protein